MMGPRLWQVSLICGQIALFSGCLFTSKTNLNEAQTQNRVLSQQNHAQLAEIENLKNHDRNLENNLIQAEEEVALLKKQADLDRRQLTNYEREHAELFKQFKTLARDRVQPPPEKDRQQTGASDTHTVR